MPLFIQLTMISSQHKIYLAIDKIVALEPNTHTKGTLVQTITDDINSVEETPEEILKMIDSAQAIAKFDTKAHRVWWAET